MSSCLNGDARLRTMSSGRFASSLRLISFLSIPVLLAQPEIVSAMFLYMMRIFLGITCPTILVPTMLGFAFFGLLERAVMRCAERLPVFAIPKELQVAFVGDDMIDYGRRVLASWY